MADFLVRTEGFERVFSFVENISDPPWHDLLEQIGMTVEQQTVYHFQMQAGPEGGWEPRKDLNPWPILIKTGTLRGSIDYEVGDMSVRIGATVDYGVFHQEGTRFIPPRPFLGLTMDDKVQLEKVVELWIQRWWEWHE